jgi:DNA repair exonuclease SbcCD ATPase subunit
MPKTPSKIIKLTSQNVKRLSAVEITPGGSLVVIGGKNGAGKSSVLDSIQYALGGEPDATMPVRRGETKATIVVDLGEIVVRRTFTAEGGGSLIVTNADGVKQSSPQSLLDGLAGRLTFDPLEFARQKPAQQAETLRQLVGLDFTKHDEERDKLFSERTTVNRDVRAMESRLAAMPKHDNAPNAEVSTAAILEEQKNAAVRNRMNAVERSNLAAAQSGLASEREKLKAMEAEIARLMEQKSKQAAHIEELGRTTADMIAAVKKLEDIDLAPFAAKASTVEADNRKVRENADREKVVKQFKSASAVAEGMTQKLEEMDSAKRKASTEAKYPVPGLLFDSAGGVVLNEIPFAQCSSAEQLKVSVAIGLALNPKLRILLIRDGSLLDDDSLKTVAEMAAKADAQVWIERVGTDEQTSVVIEDGRVASSERSAEAVEDKP